MKKMSIITKPDLNGRLTGWLKDNPNVIVTGDNHVEVVKNLMEVSAKVEIEKNK